MKKLFARKQYGDGEMSLQITSMADIFTILLVFLLKSFSVSVMNVTPSAGLVLPEAKAEQMKSEALKLEVSSSAVLLEGNPVFNLENYKPVAGDEGSVAKLTDRLQKERKRQELIAAQNSDVKVNGKVLLIADQKTPYSTIKTVLGIAASNGFSDIKLAVVQKE